jgi:hypothetical protein
MTDTSNTSELALGKRLRDESEPSGPKQKKQVEKMKKSLMRGKQILVCDAREPCEPQMYIFRVDSAPRKLLTRLALNMEKGKMNYCGVDFEEGADATDSFVDEDDENDNGDFTERVASWVEGMLTAENVLVVPRSDAIDFSMTLISA